MSDQYLGEIRMFVAAAGTKVPAGWAFCDGAILTVEQNQALYALIGNTYGGTPSQNFALPDLRGRVPIHGGTLTTGSPAPITYNRGDKGGSESVVVAASEMPSHTHSVAALNTTGQATTPSPANAVPALSSINLYGDPATTTAMGASMSYTGGNAAHNNMMPYLTIGFIIALEGIFPTSS